MIRKMFLSKILLFTLAAFTGAEAGGASSRFSLDDYPRQNGALPAADVIIDAGHGGIDGGARFGAVVEKDINLQVARRLYLMLRSKGVFVILNRDGDYALSDENRWQTAKSRHQKDLSQRRQLARELAPRLFVSLHVNWSSRTGAHGPLVLHQNEGRSALLATCIQQALNEQQQVKRYPRTGKRYFLLNRVPQPAVIVEMGFLSNDGDRAMLTNPRDQQRMAEAIAAGVRQYMMIAE